jgi:hypothetical protein
MDPPCSGFWYTRARVYPLDLFGPERNRSAATGLEKQRIQRIHEGSTSLAIAVVAGLCVVTPYVRRRESRKRPALTTNRMPATDCANGQSGFWREHSRAADDLVA